jgi:hypothetical protein
MDFLSAAQFDNDLGLVAQQCIKHSAVAGCMPPESGYRYRAHERVAADSNLNRALRHAANDVSVNPCAAAGQRVKQPNSEQTVG